MHKFSGRFLLHLFAVLVLSLLCGALYGGSFAAGADPAPTLPEDLSAGPGKMVMLDFYSPFCNTCLLMEPYLQELQQDGKDKIVFRRLDLADPTSEGVAGKLGVDGTPAYFLFDDKGNLVYKMDNLISPKILRTQVLREADALPVSVFPKNLEDLQEAQTSADYTLVSFHEQSCEPCTETDKYLNAMEFAEDDRLKVVRLDPGNKTVKQFMKDIDLETTPSYVLYDNEAHELLRLEGNLSPQVFWQYYTVLAPDETTTQKP